jgi:hypothetical protein
VRYFLVPEPLQRLHESENALALVNDAVHVRLWPRDVPVNDAVEPESVPLRLVPLVQETCTEHPLCATVQVGSWHVPVRAQLPA